MLNGVGVLGKYSGRFDEAEAAYQRALAIETSRDAPDVNVVSTLLHNIGGLDHARGRAADAVGPARQGLELRRSTQGPNGVLVAADEAALAAILVDLNELDEAVELARHAGAVYEADGSVDEHEVAAAHATLAAALHKRGDVAEATVEYQTALAAKERALGSTHPELVPTLNNIGLLHAQAGRFDEAERAYGRALQLLDAASLSDHPQHARVTRNLAALGRRRRAAD